MFVRCEAGGHKDRSARENALRTLLELFEIIRNYST